jgi:O-antigen/teichoic acid export membrane protein
MQGIAFITGPLFFGLAAVADDAVIALVGWQWFDAITPLRLLCVGQYFAALSTAAFVANVAQGRPNWVLRFNLINVAIVPLSFWGAAHWGIAGLALPWVTIIPLNRMVFTILTAYQMDINKKRLAYTLLQPSIATTIMLISVLGSKLYLLQGMDSHLQRLIAEVAIGGSAYAGYLFIIRSQIRDTIDRLLSIQVHSEQQRPNSVD